MNPLKTAHEPASRFQGLRGSCEHCRAEDWRDPRFKVPRLWISQTQSAELAVLGCRFQNYLRAIPAFSGRDTWSEERARERERQRERERGERERARESERERERGRERARESERERERARESEREREREKRERRERERKETETERNTDTDSGSQAWTATKPDKAPIVLELW